MLLDDVKIFKNLPATDRYKLARTNFKTLHVTSHDCTFYATLSVSYSHSLAGGSGVYRGLGFIASSASKSHLATFMFYSDNPKAQIKERWDEMFYRLPAWAQAHKAMMVACLDVIEIKVKD